jgi:hypothetical protein
MLNPAVASKVIEYGNYAQITTPQYQNKRAVLFSMLASRDMYSLTNTSLSTHVRRELAQSGWAILSIITTVLLRQADCRHSLALIKDMSRNIDYLPR